MIAKLLKILGLSHSICRGMESLAPNGFAENEYTLTTLSYINLVRTFVDALKLERPVIMGCSIGGRAVLHLALSFGDRLGELLVFSRLYLPKIEVLVTLIQKTFFIVLTCTEEN
ncbi:MAG: hypothetical protein CM15mP14_0640 [Rhodospirillaceae bacterium]|nr:MAG: hypothetical protein CM15mP14_0640 [Rhodospirillaceae bacterium]